MMMNADVREMWTQELTSLAERAPCLAYRSELRRLAAVYARALAGAARAPDTEAYMARLLGSRDWMTSE